MMQYMLDTNICIYLIKNKPEYLRARFNQYHGQMCISTVVLTELIYGAEKSQYPQKNTEAVTQFTSRLEILDYNDRAASHAAQIRAELERAGTPIGAYDGMIAGHARSLGLIVVTNNQREFERVAGIRVENWIL